MKALAAIFALAIGAGVADIKFSMPSDSQLSAIVRSIDELADKMERNEQRLSRLEQDRAETDRRDEVRAIIADELTKAIRGLAWERSMEEYNERRSERRAASDRRGTPPDAQPR